MRYLVLALALLSLPVMAAEVDLKKLPANDLARAGALAQSQAEAEDAAKMMDSADVVGFIIQQVQPDGKAKQTKVVVSRSDPQWTDVVKLVKAVADQRVKTAKDDLGKLGLEATAPIPAPAATVPPTTAPAQ